jgi:hypothetical protein
VSLSEKSDRLVLLLDTSWSTLKGRRSTQAQRKGEGVEGDRSSGQLLFFFFFILIFMIRGWRAVVTRDVAFDIRHLEGEDHAVQLHLGAGQDNLRVVVTFYTSINL